MLTPRRLTPVTIKPSWPWISLLAMLMALAPLSIDMYLPAMPAMARWYGVSEGVIAGSLPAFFLGLAIGQLVYGPITDRFGRKPPLYVGLSLYALASLLCLLAPSPHQLLMTRTLQALGGCVGMVVARAAIRDSFSPEQSASAYAMLLLVMGVAPIVAPLLGGWMLLVLDWRGVFGFQALYGLFALAMIHYFFRETLSSEHRQPLRPAVIGTNYAELCLDKRFILPALAGSILNSAMFAYIGASSAIVMEHFGVSAQHFGWVFGLNAGGLIVFSQFNGRLVARFGLLRVIQAGALMQALGALWVVIAAHWFEASLLATLAGWFAVIACVGVVSPNCTALSLRFQGHRAGTASALSGSLSFACGLLSSSLVHLLPMEPLPALSWVMLLMVSIGGGIVMWMSRLHPRREGINQH